MSAVMRSAAALAFLSDSLDLEALDRLRRSEHLRLVPADAASEFAHLDGDPDALVAELVRLARLAVLIGIEAHRRPYRHAATVFAEAERAVRRL
ncbi:MAG: hypothetical protein P4L73_03470 [Caulobacteraceae bacterium]|nr:hypothetical protein [Caulobacteraceae bacterium]